MLAARDVSRCVNFTRFPRIDGHSVDDHAKRPGNRAFFVPAKREHSRSSSVTDREHSLDILTGFTKSGYVVRENTAFNECIM